MTSSIEGFGTWWQEFVVDSAWVMWATDNLDSRRLNDEKRNRSGFPLVTRLKKWMEVKSARASVVDGGGFVVVAVLEVEQQQMQPRRPPYSVEQVISLRVLAVVAMPWEEKHLDFVRVVFCSKLLTEDIVFFVNTRFPLFQ